ncbi:MAG: putative quinol monooxygenase [Parvibaculum sp.]|nr:putative quinol monooxygenase [Parvibaculum sp.]
MTELTIIAFIRARPGQTLALGRELCLLVPPTLAEEGCLGYEVHQSEDDPDIWLLYESWRSAEYLDAHFETPYLQAFFEKGAALVEGEVTMHKFMRYASEGTPEIATFAA